MKQKEKLILRFLKEHGRSSTTKIAFTINSNIWRAKEYLDELKNKGKVTCEKGINTFYWEFR